jgi:hypothetical protein
MPSSWQTAAYISGTSVVSLILSLSVLEFSSCKDTSKTYHSKIQTSHLGFFIIKSPKLSKVSIHQSPKMEILMKPMHKGKTKRKDVWENCFEFHRFLLSSQRQ